jgi:hypothetical protein
MIYLRKFISVQNFKAKNISKSKNDKQVRFFALNRSFCSLKEKTIYLMIIRHYQLYIFTFIRHLKFDFVNFNKNFSYKRIMGFKISSELNEKSYVAILKPLKR